MKLSVLFSYNNKIGSTLIRLGSFIFDSSNLKWSDMPSHTALLIDNQWVVESVMHGGVRVVPYNHWKNINKEVAKIPVEKWKESPVDLVNEIWGKSYDFLGLLWFVKSVFCSKVLKKPVPAINNMEAEAKYFCVELVGRCLGFQNYSMITPAELLLVIMRLDVEI